MRAACKIPALRRFIEPALETPTFKALSCSVIRSIDDRMSIGKGTAEDPKVT